MEITFCDFCHINPHKSKIQKWLYTAKTNKGENICDQCYYFYCCVNETRKETSCVDLDCEHRPVLNGKWIKYKKWKNQ